VPFYAYQPDIYFLVVEGPMLLSRVTAHKITGGDDDDGDGATGDGMQRRWRRTTTTMRSMATA